MKFFKTPCSVLIAGPSNCGKTVFVSKLLHDATHYFRGLKPNVHYCYGAMQDKFQEMAKTSKPKIHFHEGVPTVEDLDEWFRPTGGGLLVMDDLMDECGNDKTVMDIFTKHSHHRNVSVIYITQDLFPAGKFAKTISRNVHYIVAFKNPRDTVGVRTVVLQAFPKNWKDVMTVFQKATTRPYGYFVMDFHAQTPDDHRLWTNILKEKGTYPRLYKPKQPS